MGVLPSRSIIFGQRCQVTDSATKRIAWLAVRPPKSGATMRMLVPQSSPRRTQASRSELRKRSAAAAGEQAREFVSDS